MANVVCSKHSNEGPITEKDPFLQKLAQEVRLETAYALPSARQHFNNGIGGILAGSNAATQGPRLADASHIIRECVAYLRSDAPDVFQTPAAYLLDRGTIQKIILDATKPQIPTDMSIIDEEALQEDIISMCSELLKCLPMSIGEMTSSQLPEDLRRKFENFIISELKGISPVRDLHTYLAGYFTALNKCFTAARIQSGLKAAKIFEDNRIG